ncbi:DUF21 domain-containing protein At1g47330 [Lathyrus oleraceus]|nr:DUF21 domain-containing protein At1g47330-like [Pisum sativum]
MEEERRNTTYEDEKFPGLVGIDEDEDEQRTSSTQHVWDWFDKTIRLLKGESRLNVPPYAAVLISVTLILIFGEILPQAICTRYGLMVGATLAPLVRVLLVVFYPIAYPISKVLDWMLGKGKAALLKRAELKTFVNFHGNEAGKGGDLTHDETTIIAGALELTEKTAKDAMTPISKAFSLDLDATLNLETLNSIMTMGHSRVPVYAGERTNIMGLVLVKNLFMVDSKASVPLRKMMIRKIPRVSENMPLYDILNEFQKGHSHIAVVYRDLNDKKGTYKKIKDSEQLEFQDSCKNKGKSAPLDKVKSKLVKCEQIAEAATAQLQEANEAMRAATEAAKAATETAQRMEREMNAWKEFMMKKFDSSTFVSHSHHYDDDLDDQSLDED